MKSYFKHFNVLILVVLLLTGCDKTTQKLSEATALFHQNDLTEAHLLIDEVLTDDSSNQEALALKVDVLIKQKEYTEALNYTDSLTTQSIKDAKLLVISENYPYVNHDKVQHDLDTFFEFKGAYMTPNSFDMNTPSKARESFLLDQTFISLEANNVPFDSNGFFNGYRYTTVVDCMNELFELSVPVDESILKSHDLNVLGTYYAEEDNSFDRPGHGPMRNVTYNHEVVDYEIIDEEIIVHVALQHFTMDHYEYNCLTTSESPHVVLNKVVGVNNNEELLLFNENNLTYSHTFTFTYNDNQELALVRVEFTNEPNITTSFTQETARQNIYDYFGYTRDDVEIKFISDFMHADMFGDYYYFLEYYINADLYGNCLLVDSSGQVYEVDYHSPGTGDKIYLHTEEAMQYIYASKPVVRRNMFETTSSINEVNFINNITLNIDDYSEIDSLEADLDQDGQSEYLSLRIKGEQFGAEESYLVIMNGSKDTILTAIELGPLEYAIHIANDLNGNGVQEIVMSWHSGGTAGGGEYILGYENGSYTSIKGASFGHNAVY